MKFNTVELFIERSPVIDAFLWFELAYYFSNFSFMTS